MFWAELDNPELYSKIMNDSLSSTHIYKSAGAGPNADYLVAKVVYERL